MSKKTILFVAMPDNIHTARWMEQLHEQGWDIHLFPSTVVARLHPRIQKITYHYFFYKRNVLDKAVFPQSNKPIFKLLERIFYAILRRLFWYCFPLWQAKQLAKLITELRPDIVHSLEIQNGAYLTLAAKEFVKESCFPPWIVTNWGSDIFLFANMLEHNEKIRQVLASCDYYSCECERDVQLAKDLGFHKTVLPVFPNTGGFDLNRLEKIRCQLQTSQRKNIMLKGYQHFAGRALAALEALTQCADILQGYTLVIYSGSDVVVQTAELFTHKTGIVTRIVPQGTAHDDILTLHAQARISIGLSISDGISTSLLEAMVMGAFPIQSCTACADEWIEHGVSGAIVAAEEPEIVAMWIRKALTDDDLVDRAAQINWQTALARLDGAVLTQKTIDIYNSVGTVPS